jgi:hypothetical protein
MLANGVLALCGCAYDMRMSLQEVLVHGGQQGGTERDVWNVIRQHRVDAATGADGGIPGQPPFRIVAPQRDFISREDRLALKAAAHRRALDHQAISSAMVVDFLQPGSVKHRGRI